MCSSDQNISVQIKNISKSFNMYEKPSDKLKQIIFKKKDRLSNEFWALKDVSIDIKKGSTIGLIGKNGSGKSTLLQVIAGTLKPTSGTLNINGRIAALLELGSGFNPEFTGRENIFLNGAIMGLDEEEINKSIPEIEKFADIGDFIDQPVKSYSSGMFVRLAFACAVNVNPDILIVDEALAVGDMQFQLKCIEKMKNFKNAGKTIIFVSHDTYSIRNFCDEVVWMMDGQIHMRGEVNGVTRLYEDYMKNLVDVPVANIEKSNDEVDSTKQTLIIDDVKLMNKDFVEINRFQFKDEINIQVSYTLFQPIENMVGGVALFDRENNYICGLNTKLDEYNLPNQPGNYNLLLTYNSFPMLPGTYYLDIGFFESSGLVRLDYKARFKSFIISAQSYFAEGITFIEHKWDVKGDS